MEQPSTLDHAAEPCSRSRRRANWGLFASLSFVSIIALVMGLWAAVRSESITYDSVVFIRYARQLSEADWLQSPTIPAENTRYWIARNSPFMGVIYSHAQHPGFAVLAASMHRVLSALELGDGVERWSWSVRLTSLLGFAFLVAGVYLLGRELIAPTAGLVGALAIAVSPPFVRIASDGLSDCPAAALMIWSAIAATRYLRYGQTRHVAWTAILAGMGYLIRPEALQIALVLFAVIAFQIVRPTNTNRRSSLWAMCVLVVPLAILAVPYICFKGSPLTKKAYLLDLAKEQSAEPTHSVVDHAPTPAPIARVADPVATTPLPAVDQPPPPPAPSMLAEYLFGLREFFRLWSALLGHALLVPMLLGTLLSIGIQRSTASTRLLWFAAGVNILALPMLLYCICGYLDVRHTIPACALTVPFIWPTCLHLCEVIRAVLATGITWVTGRPFAWPIGARLATAICIGGVVVAVAAVTSLQRVNRQIVGHHRFGTRLAETLAPETTIVDPSMISAFYAGLERNNRWPYVGNFSAENLEVILDRYVDTEYVLASDRQVLELMHVERMPTEIGRWRLVEVDVQPVYDEKPDELLRLFRVERMEKTAARPTTTTGR